LAAVLAAFVLLVAGTSVFVAGQSTGGGKELFEKRCILSASTGSLVIALAL
jgi:hypothetical protein